VTSIACAGLPEQLLETRMAVRFLVLFFKSSLVELFQAKGAHEMLRVELLEHGCDATARDRLVASGAQRPALGVIVSLAVGLALVVEELATDERHTTVLRTHTRMPVRI